MVKESIRLEPSIIVRRVSLAGALVIATANLPLATLPAWAQYQQQHHNTGSSKGKPAQAAQHLSPALSQSQMANMLDEVSSGKSPTLPARSSQQRKPQTQPNVMSGMRPAMGSIVRPQAGGLLRGAGMGQNTGNMGMSHGMGLSQGMGMPRGMGMSHGMGNGMGMARGLGMGAMSHGMMPMGTMGGGASNMTGGGAANFMQQFKQKFGALMPAAGAGGEESGDESGESGGAGGGGMPMMPGGMPGGGGGGMQAQLMQRLFQGQPPGGAAPAGGGMPGGLGAMMGGMAGGGMGGANAIGGMPMTRPGARGMGLGMGMPSMPQAQPHNNQSDVIKRPPGVAGIAGGASAPGRGASTSTVSDLERQMEQQYGR